jgi:polysaccharide biosynthesis protein PslA
MLQRKKTFHERRTGLFMTSHRLAEIRISLMNIEPGRIRGAQGNAPKRLSHAAYDVQPQTRSITLRIRAFALLALLDSMCILASFIVAATLRNRLMTDSSWIVILAVLIPVYLAAATNGHAYSLRNLDEPVHAVAKGLQALGLAISTVIFVAFCFKASDQFPRTVIIIGSALSFGTLAIGRYFFTKHTDMIIGTRLFHTILIREGDHVIPHGDFTVLDPDEMAFDPTAHDPVMYDRFATSLQSADRIIVLCDADRRMAWAQALKAVNIQSEIVVPELDALAPLGVGTHNQTATLIIAKGPLGLFDRVVKRAFDVIVASVALIILSPLLAIIAISIKLDSKGPVLFRQTRIGRANQMFEMLKFRSMSVDLCDTAGSNSTQRDDKRVTRVGRFIRQTSMDELPQLVTVLRGDMSIVGPRPHPLGSRAADRLFWEIDERYWHRHAAKPGLTGLAQVRGYRGATPLESDLLHRLQADLEYLDTWSIWRDLQIIFMTFRVLTHSNAY